MLFMVGKGICRITNVAEYNPTLNRHKQRWRVLRPKMALLVYVHCPYCYMGGTKHICIGSDCLD